MSVEKLGLPPLPSFVIIGAPGCATRWLRFNLDRHPEIYAPPRFARAEPAFLFHDERLNGEELIAYRRGFTGWGGEPLIGALEPRCMIRQTRPSPEDGTVGEPLTVPLATAARMSRGMPECRFVLMVRNPIDRLEADFRRAVERGAFRLDADLPAMLSEFDLRLVNLDIYAGGMYTEAIEAFRGRFGENLLVQFYDDVVDDPVSVYRSVLDHIGASTDFVPDDLDRVRYEPHDTVPAVQLSQKDRVALFDFAYRTQVADLEKLTGRDLSGWIPGLEAKV